MAETFTTRFGLIQWGAPTDGPTRVEFNNAFLQVENLGAIDKQGTLGARPAAGVRGTYYWATDSSILFRDDGSAWTSVGGRGTDAVFSSSAIGAVPLTLNAASGQTANLLTANVNSVALAEITSTGSFISAATYTGKSLLMVNNAAANIVADFKGAASQSADLLRLRNSADTDLFRVTPAGVVIGSTFRIESNKAIFGGTTVSSVTGSFFTGNPLFEMVGVTGGASNTYKDFVLIQHQAADGNAVQRALGLHIMVDTTSEAKSGSLYLTSSAANFANPSLILALGGTAALTLPTGGNATLGTSRGLTIPTDNDATLAQTAPSFMIGTSGGANLIMSSSKIAARNNGATAALNLNPQGGTVNVGGDLTVTGTVTGAGIIQKITEVVLGSNQSPVTISSIPATFKHLLLIFYGQASHAGNFVQLYLRFNSDSGTNYDMMQMYATGDTGTTTPGKTELLAQDRMIIGEVGTSTAVPGEQPTGFTLLVHGYSSTAFWKICTVNASIGIADSSSYLWTEQTSGRWRSTAAINSITLGLVVGGGGATFQTGSIFSLYGLP